MTTPSVRLFAAHLAARADAAEPPPALLGRVRAALGPDGYAAVVAPQSAEGVAAVLAACTEEHWPVVPLGGATWLQGYARADAGRSEAHAAASDTKDQIRPPVLLSTVRLDRVTEHEPADLVIGVQAGLTLERLEALLAAQNQWLPLDPPAASEATIGAIAALSAAGPLRAGHGTPRDMALGVEIATGDGRLLRFGGRVVKNVAGYDGVRLAVGSRGRLGVITGLFLRVRGAPRADRTLAIDCGPGVAGARRGADLALTVRDAVNCDALELLAPAVASRVSGRSSGWMLLVRMLGSDAAVSDGLGRVRGVAVRLGGVRGGPAEVPGTVWKALARLESEATAAVRFTGRPTDLTRGLEALTTGVGTYESGEAAGPRFVAAHAADGIVRAWRAELLAASDEARTATASAGRGAAAASSSHGTAAPTAAASDVRSDLTHRLRTAFDPAAILRGAGEEG